MAANDNAGRISRHAYVSVVLTLFALCLVSATARFYVRVRIQKQVSIDDGFLLFGILCLAAAVGVMFTFMDSLYMLQAMQEGIPDLEMPPDWLQRAFDCQKFLVVSLCLTWCSIAAVKFSFLFLFRRLIDRIPRLIIYWWIVMVFNVAVAGYGIAVNFLACPWYYDMRVLQCGRGSYVHLAERYAMSHIVLDIIGDLLILYIPVRLIWQIRVKWTEKAALSLSLCLTIVIIVVTITRAAGLHQHERLDTVWESFWQTMSAEVGLIMTSLTAFRALFVARSNNDERRPPRNSSERSWSLRSRKLLRRFFFPSAWRSRSTGQSSSGQYEQKSPGQKKHLPSIPRGILTGVRTFIDGRGGTTMDASRMMQSTMATTDDSQYSWPMSTKIQVRHEISSTSERLSDDARQPQHGREYV